MQVLVVEDQEAVAAAGAEAVAAAMRERPALALVAATGASPMGVYRELALRHRQGRLDTSQLHTFQLDEYVGIGADDRRSLFRWMKSALLDPLGIPATRTARLRGDAPDLQAACRSYDHAVAWAGGFDLAILGLGPNGHLGFNEPPSGPEAGTRVVTLTPESLRSNAAYWGNEDDVPRRALTAGMNLLLAARRIVLLVSGAHKQEILARTIGGPITPDVPASYLRTVAGVTIVADRLAARLSGVT